MSTHYAANAVGPSTYLSNRSILGVCTVCENW